MMIIHRERERERKSLLKSITTLRSKHNQTDDKKSWFFDGCCVAFEYLFILCLIDALKYNRSAFSFVHHKKSLLLFLILVIW